jgi:hypothetical protein
MTASTRTGKEVTNVGYGIIHVWIMTEQLRPAVGARWIIDVFDCRGRRPLGYYSYDEGATWSKEKVPCFNMVTTEPNNPHLAVKVPPGCYKVDARQTGCQNPVHQTMVVLPSLAEVNVYLIAGTDGWLRRILPVVEVRARMRPVPPVTSPVEPPRPSTTYAAKPPVPYLALKEEEVKMAFDLLGRIRATIPVEERAPIDSEAVDCWIRTVDTAEAKEALQRTRQFLVG